MTSANAIKLKASNPPSVGLAILFACQVILVVSLFGNLAFLAISTPYESFHTARNGFAFRSPIPNVLQLAILLIAVTAILRDESIVISTGIAFVLGLVMLPVFAYSGPSEDFRAVQPLLMVQLAITMAIILISCLAAILVRRL